MNASLPARATAPALSQRLPGSAEMKTALPVEPALALRINQHRQAIRAVLHGDDDRLLVVAGPCSIHDPAAALEYAQRLAQLAEAVSDRLLVVMRAYVEKPRTTVGWKGLLYDPHLDGSHDMATGLHTARALMRDIARLGLPLATEILHPMAAGYLDDLLSWAAIGARTTESQIHRELVSGLGLPAGFKNGTDGGVSVAVDAIRSAAAPHQHFGIDSLGHPAIIRSTGNPDTHLVLRGGRHGPNYAAEHVRAAREALTQAGVTPRIMVDCSHANSSKDHRRQALVLQDVIAQRRAGDTSLMGVMLESHLAEGNQPLCEPLRYGVSITDACIGWDDTAQLLHDAAEALR